MLQIKTPQKFQLLQISSEPIADLGIAVVQGLVVQGIINVSAAGRIHATDGYMPQVFSHCLILVEKIEKYK